MDFHDPYHFNSSHAYLLARRKWAEDYRLLSGKIGDQRRLIAETHREGGADIYVHWRNSQELRDLRLKARALIDKRHAMKKEANRQWLEKYGALQPESSVV
jgi:phenylpropionate dioxygenase-like ring-hydroxylating dioxygenase large terminal subunit